MALMDPSELLQDAVPECVVTNEAIGKYLTFYRVPMPCKGPVLRKDKDGRRYMAFMYAHFVFHWYATEGTVSIFHGNIDGSDNWPLPWTFNIDSDWDRATLAERAKQWTREHKAQFRKPR